jgi:hypothetical protein
MPASLPSLTEVLSRVTKAGELTDAFKVITAFLNFHAVVLADRVLIAAALRAAAERLLREAKRLEEEDTASGQRTTDDRRAIR